MSLKGITSLSLGEMLVGSEIFIEKRILPDLEEGSYYWYDIIGISVFTTDDQYIGRVKSIIPTGSNDVLVVKDPNRDKDNEVLIPVLESVVLEIDLKDKTMRVDLPDGL
jgi:16S rRNA processing protein RimM